MLSGSLLDDELPEPRDWRCEDVECGDRWTDSPEIARCECGIGMCPNCAQRCYSCNAPVCSAHRELSDVGDGRRAYCGECMAHYRAEQQNEIAA